MQQAVAENWTAPGLALQLLGGALVIDSIRVLPDAWASRRWLRVPGHISTSDYQASTDGEGGRGHVRPFALRIEFEYTVGKDDYQGNQLSYRGYAPTLNRVVSLRRRYPAGALVDVWYDPKDPERSVLEPGVGIGLWGELVLGLALIAIGSLVRRAV